MSFQNKLRVKKIRRDVRIRKRRGTAAKPQNAIIDKMMRQQHQYRRDHGLPYSEAAAGAKALGEKAA